MYLFYGLHNSQGEGRAGEAGKPGALPPSFSDELEMGPGGEEISGVAADGRAVEMGPLGRGAVWRRGSGGPGSDGLLAGAVGGGGGGAGGGKKDGGGGGGGVTMRQPLLDLKAARSDLSLDGMSVESERVSSSSAAAAAAASAARNLSEIAPLGAGFASGHSSPAHFSHRSPPFGGGSPARRPHSSSEAAPPG